MTMQAQSPPNGSRDCVEEGRETCDIATRLLSSGEGSLLQTVATYCAMGEYSAALAILARMSDGDVSQHICGDDCGARAFDPATLLYWKGRALLGLRRGEESCEALALALELWEAPPIEQSATLLTTISAPEGMGMVSLSEMSYHLLAARRLRRHQRFRTRLADNSHSDSRRSIGKEEVHWFSCAADRKFSVSKESPYSDETESKKKSPRLIFSLGALLRSIGYTLVLWVICCVTALTAKCGAAAAWIAASRGAGISVDVARTTLEHRSALCFHVLLLLMTFLAGFVAGVHSAAEGGGAVVHTEAARSTVRATASATSFLEAPWGTAMHALIRSSTELPWWGVCPLYYYY